MPYDLPDWLEQKIIPEPNSGCWLWLGATGPDGYGLVRLGRHNGKAFNHPAHRLVYEFYNGPTDAETIDHLCRMPSCVNPVHLEPVTHKVNILRGTGASARNAIKTHCPQGHLYSEHGFLIGSKKNRKCRICHNATQLRYERRKKMR